jgi:hypothetical protein
MLIVIGAGSELINHLFCSFVRISDGFCVFVIDIYELGAHMRKDRWNEANR